jgi:hypothetical protein
MPESYAMKAYPISTSSLTLYKLIFVITEVFTYFHVFFHKEQYGPLTLAIVSALKFKIHRFSFIW